MSVHHSEALDGLFEAILSLRDPDECYMFFDDICTGGELLMISQRLEVAKELSSGKKYSRISEETGASSATISRVNRCLLYGSGGYRLILDRVNEKTSDVETEKK